MNSLVYKMGSCNKVLVPRVVVVRVKTHIVTRENKRTEGAGEDGRCDADIKVPSIVKNLTNYLSYPCMQFS